MAVRDVSDAIDPTTVSVIQHYLTAAAREMHRTLVRTAYNSIIYEILDFGISIYDAECRLISDSPGLAIFLGANDTGIRNGVEQIGIDAFEPGDIALLNYPYWSHAHTLDVLVFAPIFHGDSLRGFTACRAHWLDLGAKDPGYVLDSTDVHQEGVIFPGTKVYKQGEPDQEIIDLIKYNSRLPNKVIGDLNAQIAALRTGNQRVIELYERYGQSTVDHAIDAILAHGEAQAEKAVRALPDGAWSATGEADPVAGVDQPITIEVTVTIDGSSFDVDFSESADQLELPYNDPGASSVAKLCFKTVTTPDETTNAGHYAPLSVTTREGSIFEPTYPAPTFVGWTGILAVDVVYKALADAMPELVSASSGGDLCSIMFFGHDDTTDRGFVEANNDGVGWGATHDHDGQNALMHITETMVRNIPIEVFEHRAPVRIERLALREDSGGHGRYRGGLGIRRDYRVTDEVGALSIVQKTRSAGWGIDGGQPGVKNVVVLDVADDGPIQVLVDNADLYGKEGHVGMMRGAFQSGDLISNRSGGGGGVGEPFNRDAKAVLQDVIDGYVSRDGAREAYGVIITPDYEIDWGGTRRQRDV